MGLTSSKPTQSVVSQQAYNASPQFMAPDGILTKIKGLGEVIGFFNDNDTSSLSKFVDVYNQQVNVKERIELGPEIKGMMMTFHNQLLQVIDQQMGMTATSSEKEEALKNKLKDNRQLNDMLKMYYTQKFQDIEARVLGDDMVKNSTELTTSVKVILNNVKALKVKYKFFEYKYIQLNLFMIVFVQYVYNSMTKFIVDVIAYNQARDAIRQEMTSKIFKATQEIMGASDIELKPQDALAINKMIADLQERVTKDQVEIQELSSKLKNNSMSDLLNFILKSDDALASHVMGSVDKYKQDKNIPSQPLQQPQQNQQQNQQQPQQQKQNPQPQKQQNQQQKQYQQNQQQNQQQKPQVKPQQPVPLVNLKTNAKTNANVQPIVQPNAQPNVRPNAQPELPPQPQEPNVQTGGFIRDMSMLPQAFYNFKA